MTKILVADDHQLMREAVIQLLGLEFQNAQFSTAASLDQVLGHLASPTAFALILLDLRMPGMRGADSVKTIVEASNNSAVIVWTGVESPDLVLRLKQAGVSAVVSKSQHSDDLLNVVRTLGFNERMAAVGGDNTVAKPPLQNDLQDTRNSGTTLLTTRQLDILRLLHEGKPNKIIARELDVALGTVKNHLYVIFTRLQIKSRAELLVHTKEWFI